MKRGLPVGGATIVVAAISPWTIGKKYDRVFEAGISNLTSPECPCLIHIGKDNTKQWMLVRQQQPAGGN